jgi:hypothetical protein
MTIAQDGAVTLSGVSGTGAVGTMTATAPAGLLFSDYFTATNGSAPDPAKWGSLVDGAGATSSVEIQGNALRFRQGGTNPTYNASHLPTVDDFTPAAGRRARAVLVGSVVLGRPRLRLNGVNGSWVSLRVESIEIGEEEWATKALLTKYNGTTTVETEVADFGDVDVVSPIFEYRFITATTVDLYVGGIKRGATQTIPSLGASFKVAPEARIQGAYSGGLYQEFDTVEVE